MSSTWPEQTIEYRSYEKAISQQATLRGGHVGLRIAPYATIYLPDLEEQDNFPPFLERVFYGEKIDPRLVHAKKKDWRYVGYGERPRPRKALQLTPTMQTDQPVQAFFVKEKKAPRERLVRGNVLVEVETFYDCGENSFAARALLPLCAQRHKQDFAHIFQVGARFEIEKSARTWTLVGLTQDEPSLVCAFMPIIG